MGNQASPCCHNSCVALGKERSGPFVLPSLLSFPFKHREERLGLRAVGNSSVLVVECAGLSSVQCRGYCLGYRHFTVVVLYLVSFAHIYTPLP